jgi:hypothetical protein
MQRTKGEWCLRATPINWEHARGVGDKVSGKCIKHERSLLFLLTATSTMFDYIHYIRLHRLQSTMSTPLSLKINDMSSLFSSYSEMDHMIGCPMFYRAYLDLSVNCNYLAYVWIWLYACLSYDSRLCLVKIFIYHVSFVTIIVCFGEGTWWSFVVLKYKWIIYLSTSA